MVHSRHCLYLLADSVGAVTSAAVNPDRELAQGKDLITIYALLFCNDVSRAQLKQYQKHINVYAQNWSLPSWFQWQDSLVQFISTSPTAGSCKLLGPILKAVKYTSSSFSKYPICSDTVRDRASKMNPTWTYNATTQHFCHVCLLVPCLPADNLQHSEEASHTGVNANCKCCKCKKGGPGEARESDDGYNMLYHTNFISCVCSYCIHLTKSLCVGYTVHYQGYLWHHWIATTFHLNWCQEACAGASD